MTIMGKLTPLVISVAGSSGAGKTTLVEKLLRELSQRKYAVAAVKHCPHGFGLDIEGKDSWRFAEAGARGIFLTSPRRIGLIKDTEQAFTLKSIAERYFYDLDVVLGEGFSEDKEVGKIVMFRKVVSNYVPTLQNDILALVSDFEIETEKPVFKPDDASGISDFIEQLLVQQSPMKNSVTLNINKKPVPLNEFVQAVFKNVILGLIAILWRGDKELKEIEIKIYSFKEVKKDE